MRDAKDVVPYDVVVILFVGEDSILPLKLDVFRFGRLIAYPYKFDGNGWPTYGVERDKFGKVLRKYYMPRY